jgi:hypothetical protein
LFIVFVYVDVGLQVVKGQLTLNRTCWAGIGVSSAMNMANASVFLIGSLNSTSSTPMVGLYDVANVPYGHAPPVVRAHVVLFQSGHTVSIVVVLRAAVRAGCACGGV